MRRLLGWTAGVVGIAALARTLTRRRPHGPAPAALPPVDDRAEALRRKLEETRTVEHETATPSEPPAEDEEAAAPKPVETLEERRARVHAKAQEAIAAMQEPLE